jgi:hypothetical protein
MTVRTKNHRGFHPGPFVLLLALALSCLCLVVTGAPFDGFVIEDGAIKAGTYEPPVLFVKATRSREVYDTLDQPGDLKFSVKVRGQCAEKERIVLAGIDIQGKGKHREPFFVPVGPEKKRSIGGDHGEDWEVYGISIPFIAPDTPQSLVTLCNERLSKAASDAERIELLQNGFNFELEKAYHASLSVQCQHKVLGLDELKNLYSGTYLPVKVRCLPTHYGTTKGPPPRPGRPLEVDPPIASISVDADPVDTKGKLCPLYVNFRARITAGEKSQYSTFNTKYRFIGDHNYETDWMPVSIVRGQPRSVLGRRFIQISDTPRGFKTPGAKGDIPIFHGWMLLEVMLPDGTKRSERATFSVDCNPQPVTNVKGR